MGKKIRPIKAWALRYVNTPIGFNIYKMFETRKDAVMEASTWEYLYPIKSMKDVIVEVEIRPCTTFREKKGKK